MGGYHDARGGCSVPWGDIMMHVGNIMSTMEGVQYCEEKIFCYSSTHGTEHPPRYS